MILNASKDSRLDVVTLLAPTFSSSCNFGPFLDSFSNIVEDTIKLFLADDGSLGGFFVLRMTNFDSLGVFNATLYELVIDRFMDVGS